MAQKTTFILEADEAKAVNAFLKVIDAQTKTADGMRKITREADKTRAVLMGVGQAAAGFGIATGFVDATRQAVGLLVKELEDLRRKEKEAAETTQNYAKTFSQNIGQWLGAGMIDKAHAALTGLVKENPNLSYTTGQAILSAYAEQRPKATLEQGIKATRLAAPLAYGQIEMAKLIGELEEIAPEKTTTEDLADIAVRIQKRAGKHREEIESAMKQVHQMVAVGINWKDAIATMMTAFGEEQAGRAMTGMAGLIEKFKEGVERKPGQMLSPEQKIIRETKGMTEEQIYQWIYANPEKVEKIAGPKQWVQLAPLFKPGAFEEQKKEVEQAQREDEYQKELKAQRESALVTTARIATEREAAVERLKIGYTPGAIKGFTRKAAYDLLASAPGVGKIERDLLLGAIEIEGRVGGEYAAAAIGRLTSLQQQFAAPTRRRPQIGFYPGVPSAYMPPAEWAEERNPRYAPDFAEAIGGLIKNIQEQAAAFEKMDDVSKSQDELVRALKDNTKAIREARNNVVVMMD
jgi:hypothetical protein